MTIFNHGDKIVCGGVEYTYLCPTLGRSDHYDGVALDEDGGLAFIVSADWKPAPKVVAAADVGLQETYWATYWAEYVGTVPALTYRAESDARAHAERLGATHLVEFTVTKVISL